MGLKNILVPYNGTTSANRALAQALSIAEERGAHVTGCFPYEAFDSLGVFDLPMSRPLKEDFRKIAKRMETEARKAVEERFREATSACAAPDRLHCLDITGDTDIAITKAARHFDLTVISPADPEDDPDARQVHPDVIALRSGKPVLIVPKGKPTGAIGRRVVLAWDGKRAAARAVGEVLQMFGPIGAAFVLRVGAPDEAADFWSGQLCDHLARHDTPATFLRRDESGSIAATILDVCNEVGADLLVMGAYEHSKFGEDLLGGTTNDILAGLSIPVFMAH
ncbi:universal stress protein [Sinisalibacter aestuarii]|uniref:Universal stress protein A n=1 Tax=Sinisalibacter aestuarii TaxID=2949426 RepID=A0ABQ5M0L3_9RHOB|nr:universal stress protein [Sinisalibacter aestuarii]GKY90112.1 universal stress protein A [Sinisalibacter aestuarii]